MELENEQCAYTSGTAAPIHRGRPVRDTL